MTKVVIADLKAAQAADAKMKPPPRKQVRDSDGKVRMVSRLDLRSPSFVSDLEHVFARNVAKARRENVRITGSADGSGAKP